MKKLVGQPQKKWLHGVDKAFMEREIDRIQIKYEKIYEDKKNFKSYCEMHINWQIGNSLPGKWYKGTKISSSASYYNCGLFGQAHCTQSNCSSDFINVCTYRYICFKYAILRCAVEIFWNMENELFKINSKINRLILMNFKMYI